jgi:uncharacterized protein (DUF488 family)
VADVRSRPYSRFVPHFSKERLARRLQEAGVGYLYLGAELGGKPPRQDPPATRLDYQERVRQPAFENGIKALLDALRDTRLALLCRERDPLDCHRLHLICRHIKPMVADIGHIRPDGGVEAHAAAERRLIERAGLKAMPLFEEAGEGVDPHLLERAYDLCWTR